MNYFLASFNMAGKPVSTRTGGLASSLSRDTECFWSLVARVSQAGQQGKQVASLKAQGSLPVPDLD